MPLQAASAKEASAASREALEVSRLEGEELCRQLSEMQERLSTTEAQLQTSQKAASSKLAMAGAAWPGFNSLDVPVTGPSLCISQHPAGVNSLYIWIKVKKQSLILIDRHGCRQSLSSGSRNRA